MKDKTGLIMALIGIAMLAGIIIYQAKTQKSITYLIPIALLVNLFGLYHLKKAN